MIALFRNQTGVLAIQVQLPLLPHGRFRVRSLITGKELGVFTKADWTRGVPVTFAGAQTVELLEVNAAP